MKNVFLISLLALFFTPSCNFDDSSNRIQTEYSQSLMFFDENLVNAFPGTLPQYAAFSTNVLNPKELINNCFGESILYMWTQLDEKTMDEYLVSFSSRNMNGYNTNDSSLLLIFSYCDEIESDGKISSGWESVERQKLAKYNKSIPTASPIPYFDIDEFSGENWSGLSNDFKLYILGAESGTFINEKYLEECECLPDKWKHGYSKGIAISEERWVAIYWIVVW